MDSANIVVFDLETQRSLAEVGGRAGIARLGISIGVTYSYRDRQFYHYEESQLDELVASLRESDLVVGFNLLRFDYPVLQAYADAPMRTLPTLDMLAHIHRALGFRVSLDSLARNTLGIRKTADGTLALRWWRDGRLDLIRDYCQQDVDITRRLYEFGRDNGYVVYWDRRRRRPSRVSVDW